MAEELATFIDICMRLTSICVMCARVAKGSGRRQFGAANISLSVVRRQSIYGWWRGVQFCVMEQGEDFAK